MQTLRKWSAARTIKFKIAWADAEQPNYLVILVSSYLSNNARVWLEQIRGQKHY
jgi:hypothetical protein